MTGQKQSTTADDAINTLLEHGLADGLPRIAEMLLNAAMLLERAAHLHAQPRAPDALRVRLATG